MILIETMEELGVNLGEMFLRGSITKNVRREGLADILCMAGVACYGNRVTPAKGGSS